MKRYRKTIFSMLILLVILITLALVSQYRLHSKNNDKDSTFEEDLYEKFIKSAGLDFAFMEETIEMEEIEYTVLSAEYLTEIREDEYYNQRGKIEPEIEFWSRPSKADVIYSEELTYTYVTVELKNNSDTTKLFEYEKPRLYNIEDEKLGVGFDMCDWKTWDKDGNVSDWDFTLEPKESRKVEFFYVTFLPSSYNLYITFDKPLHQADSYLCISLNIIQTEKKERDLALLKALHGTTNYDLAKKQTEGSVVLERYFFDSDETVGPYQNVVEMGEIYDSKKYTILNVELIDSYDKIPENFKNRSYLQEMTNTYQKNYGFKAEDLQYLFITVRLEQFQDVMETLPVTVSQLMWLYNRKDGNTLWKIGYADDYEVSESEDGEFVHMDTYQDREGAVHYVTAAYVIWPGALQDVYLWTNDGPVRDGESNAYNLESPREQGGGIHVELP